MSLQNTDNLIVQRGSDLYATQIQNMSTIQDADLLLIGRGSESYKITGQDFMDQVNVNPPDPDVPPVINSVSLVESNPDADPRFTDQEFVTSVSMTEEGTPVSTKTIDAYVEGSINGVDNIRKYLAFESDGTVTDLLDAPQNPAYTTTANDPTLTLTFPSVFLTGQAPDDELGDGTKLVVEATASNAGGTSGPLSAEVQPEDGGGGGPALGGMTTLYTGTGAAGNQTIVNGIDLANNGGMVWIKGREVASRDNRLFNTESGATIFLSSNTSNNEQTSSNSLVSFNSDGFEVDTHYTVNEANKKMVAWTFGKAENYFDVIEQKGLSGLTTIPHSLKQKPGMIIAKRTNASQDWWVYHSSAGAGLYAKLNVNSSLDSLGNRCTSPLMEVIFGNLLSLYFLYFFSYSAANFS